ncbi:MAG: amidohydrolase family protein [Candidatus Methylomirabilales bacterium]
MRRLLSAPWVLPVAGPPLPDGALLVADGRIEAVGPRSALRGAAADAPEEAFPGAALLPGLVNVHTHLELSGLRGTLPEGRGLLPWVLALIERKRGLEAPWYRASVQEGIGALLRAGTTCVGEVTSAGVSPALLRESGLRGVIYWEVLGPDPATAAVIAAKAAAALAELATLLRGSPLIVGLSPHALYSTTPALRAALRRLRDFGSWPAAIHAAESREEVDFVREGVGPLWEGLLKPLGIPEPEGHGVGPLALLEAEGWLGPGTVVIHAAQAEPADAARLARTGTAVACCPRSNAALGVGIPPLSALHGAGIRLGLGTDSLASVPSLSLWDELRAARALFPELPARDWLRMLTLGGAEVLGLADRIGSLTPGKEADCIAVRLPEGEDPERLLLETGTEEAVCFSMVGGRVLLDARAATGDRHGR